MNKKITVILVVILIIIGAIISFNNQKSNITSTVSLNPAIGDTNQSTNANIAPTLMTSTGQLLTDSQFYNKAYEVYPNLDPVNGSLSLSGFSLQKEDLGNGMLRITLVAKQSNYNTQSFIISPDQKIYFIETSFRDDNNDKDINFGDDTGIAVDAQGYILK